jgi:hypothetical protein
LKRESRSGRTSNRGQQRKEVEENNLKLNKLREGGGRGVKEERDRMNGMGAERA